METRSNSLFHRRHITCKIIKFKYYVRLNCHILSSGDWAQYTSSSSIESFKGITWNCSYKTSWTSNVYHLTSPISTYVYLVCITSFVVGCKRFRRSLTASGSTSHGVWFSTSTCWWSIWRIRDLTSTFLESGSKSCYSWRFPTLVNFRELPDTYQNVTCILAFLFMMIRSLSHI